MYSAIALTKHIYSACDILDLLRQQPLKPDALTLLTDVPLRGNPSRAARITYLDAILLVLRELAQSFVLFLTLLFKFSLLNNMGLTKI